MTLLLIISLIPSLFYDEKKVSSLLIYCHEMTKNSDILEFKKLEPQFLFEI